jgi:Flp pilus assembly protein TadB
MADETVHTDASPAPPPGEAVHLPGPTYLPVLTALGLTFAVVGIVLSIILVALGLVITIVALWLWIRDTRRDISELPLEH